MGDRMRFVPTPAHALSPEERQAVLDVCNSQEFASLPPSQIVPRLADQGVTWPVSRASIASCGRLTSSTGVAGASHRVMCRYQPAIPRLGPIKCGLGYHLLAVTRPRPVLLPLSDRGHLQPQRVGWEVHEQECGERAAALLQRSIIREQCWKQPLVLHSDNGAPMKSVTLLTKMHDLGVTPSRGRPRVSNDNPYSESLFRTLKYCPQWPSDGFASLEAARSGCATLWPGITKSTGIAVSASSHPTSGIGVTIKPLLAKRDAVYQAARSTTPSEVEWQDDDNT